jgi:hypothetical protein
LIHIAVTKAAACCRTQKNETTTYCGLINFIHNLLLISGDGPASIS